MNFLGLRSTDAAGERCLYCRAGVQSAQHHHRVDGGQRQLGRDIGRDGCKAEHADLKRLPGRLHRAQVVGTEVLDAKHQRLASRRLLHRVSVDGELVSDGGADQVGAVGIEAFLHQKIDLAEIDVAKVDGDFLVERLAGRNGCGASGWHSTILAPSKWMVKARSKIASLMSPGTPSFGLRSTSGSAMTRSRWTTCSPASRRWQA